jgi:hypothetical protein
MSKTFPEKIDQNFDVEFLSTCFVLLRFRLFLSDGILKPLQKRLYQKIQPKSFCKKSTKKTKPIASRFSISFHHVFWVLGVSWLGVQKHDRKYRQKLTSPAIFLASEEPTNHFGVRRFLSAPW